MRALAAISCYVSNLSTVTMPMHSPISLATKQEHAPLLTRAMERYKTTVSTMSRQDYSDRKKPKSLDPCGAQITKENSKKTRRTKKSQKG